MNKQKVLNHLKSIGLSDDESALYLYLLSNGESTPLQISRDIQLNRSKIYRITEDLKEKKLIEETESAWGRKLRAAAPENLELMLKEEELKLEEKKDTFKTLITDLKSMTPVNTNSFYVKYFSGTDGLKQMMWNELKAKEIYSFSHGFFNQIVGKSFADKIRKEYVVRNVKLWIIENDITTPTKENQEYYKHNFTAKTLDKRTLEIEHMIDIYEDVVSIIDWDNEKRSGIEIHNSALARMFKGIFQHYWSLV